MKSIVNRFFTAVLATMMVLTITACSSSGTTAPAAGGGQPAATVKNPNIDDGKNILGIAYSNFAAEATQVLIKNYENSYKEYGFDELIILQAENNLERQIDQIQDLVNQKCDMIIVNSVDPDGIVPVVDSVIKQGIPIVAVDRRINTSIYYTLETDNVACGRDVAKTLALRTLTPDAAPGSVEVLKCVNNMTSSAVRDRLSGFNEEMTYWPHMKVVAEPSIESSIEKAYNAVIDGFKANPNIKIVYVSGDNFVAPVVSALNEIGKLYPQNDPRHILVASIDGTSSALEGILKGENDVCANQRFDMFCYDILKICQNYMKGELVPAMSSNVKLPTPIVVPENIRHLQDMGVLWGLPKGK